MNHRESADLDRYITGNWGEDQNDIDEDAPLVNGPEQLRREIDERMEAEADNVRFGDNSAPDPRIAAAEKMAKALEAGAKYIYEDMGEYGVRMDYADSNAMDEMNRALAAWNALK